MGTTRRSPLAWNSDVSITSRGVKDEPPRGSDDMVSVLYDDLCVLFSVFMGGGSSGIALGTEAGLGVITLRRIPAGGPE